MPSDRAGPHCSASRGGPASLAGAFASLGLLDDAAPLLDELGWDGHVDRDGDAGMVASAYERTLGAETRHTFGVHYTPPVVADGLVRAVIDGIAPPVRVGDPSCGAGVFLVAAAHALQRAGVPIDRIVAEALFGADVDPGAIALARAQIALWAARTTGRVEVVPDDHLVVADGLIGAAMPSWLDQPGTLDVVIGNPPFGAQLRGGTVRDERARALLSDRLGVGALGYADTAALFLLRAVDLVRPGGWVALILPASVAAATGSTVIRAEVTRRSRIAGVWTGGDDVGFEAAVSVWAPMLHKDDSSTDPAGIVRYHGARVERLDRVDVGVDPSSWAPLLTRDPVGGPRWSGREDRRSSTGDPTRTVAAVARVTAGFRQHFYGLAPHVTDAPEAAEDAPVLVTTGAIDPCHYRRDATVRFAGRRFDRPVIDLAALESADPGLGAWVRSMLVPKVLVATQGRVVEAIVDAKGTMVPSTPVIAVLPEPGSDPTIWQLGALLLSPFTSLSLHHSAAGTGLGRGCRVTSGFVAALELPGDRVAWDVGAVAAQAATRAASADDADAWAEALDRLGAAMVDAVFPADAMTDRPGPDERARILSWWREQRPRWRGARLLNR